MVVFISTDNRNNLKGGIVARSVLTSSVFLLFFDKNSHSEREKTVFAQNVHYWKVAFFGKHDVKQFTRIKREPWLQVDITLVRIGPSSVGPWKKRSSHPILATGDSKFMLFTSRPDTHSAWDKIIWLLCNVDENVIDFWFEGASTENCAIVSALHWKRKMPVGLYYLPERRLSLLMKESGLRWRDVTDTISDDHGEVAQGNFKTFDKHKWSETEYCMQPTKLAFLRLFSLQYFASSHLRFLSSPKKAFATETLAAWIGIVSSALINQHLSWSCVFIFVLSSSLCHS